MKKYLFFLLSAPVFIWILLKIPEVFGEFLKFPGYVRSNVSSLFLPDKLEKMEDVRWNAFGPGREDFASKLFYNKAYILIDNFFSYLSFFSPRYFFQSGDNTQFSARKADPILSFLFVFWVLGTLDLIRNKNFKPLAATLFFGFLAFAAGQKNFAFLLPVIISYDVFAHRGVKILPNRLQKTVFILVVFYGLFSLGRMFLT